MVTTNNMIHKTKCKVEIKTTEKITLNKITAILKNINNIIRILQSQNHSKLQNLK